MYSGMSGRSITKIWCKENFCGEDANCLLASESRIRQGFWLMEFEQKHLMP